jgi:hypothetical protein
MGIEIQKRNKRFHLKTKTQQWFKIQKPTLKQMFDRLPPQEIINHENCE